MKKIRAAVFANIGMGYIFEHFGWDGGFILLLSACAVTVVLMLFCKENRL